VRRFVVIANQTLGCAPLIAAIDELQKAEPTALHLLAPVTRTEGEHQWDYPAIDRLVPDAATIAKALAEGRLANELHRLRSAGVTADGEVVDADPVQRLQELVSEQPFDGVVVCTLPTHLSRWLHTDLPHRVARATDLPLTHVPGEAGPSL